MGTDFAGYGNAKSFEYSCCWYKGGGYDYYWLISGQDWPLRSADKIVKFFEEHNGTNFVQYWNSKNHGSHQQNNLDKRNQIYFQLNLLAENRGKRSSRGGGLNSPEDTIRRGNFERKQLGIEFYFGSSWWALKRETIDWIMQYITTHPEYYKFYENATCPDESFFQTLVMISPYADENTDYLTYLHFQKGANSPDILTEDNLQRARESKYLIMRKVDMNVDDSFLQI